MFVHNQETNEKHFALSLFYVNKIIPLGEKYFLINTNFLTEHILLINDVSQQYILTIRMDLITSDMILIRSSVIFKILALIILKCRKCFYRKKDLLTEYKQINGRMKFESLKVIMYNQQQ